MTREPYPSANWELAAPYMPIEAGPILIDDLPSAAHDHGITHMSIVEFTHGALSNGLVQNMAGKSLELTVRVLINSRNLNILPPGESQGFSDHRDWGPYNTGDYHIEYGAFLESWDEVSAALVEVEHGDAMAIVLEYVRKIAEKEMSYRTSHIPVEELPDVVYTEVLPEEHLEDGNLFTYDDFARAAHEMVTSPGKAAVVFDTVVRELSAGAAKEQLAKLDRVSNPGRRRHLRSSLYIKTQALADLIERIESMPRSQRGGYTERSITLLRQVLYGEDPLADEHVRYIVGSS